MPGLKLAQCASVNRVLADTRPTERDMTISCRCHNYIDLLCANEIHTFAIYAHTPLFWMSTLYSKYWRKRVWSFIHLT